MDRTIKTASRQFRSRWVLAKYGESSGSRVVIVLLLLSLHVGALALTASEALHDHVHESGDGATHECLVTLLQSGQIDSVDPACVAVQFPSALPFNAVPAAFRPAFPVPGLLPPGRAPPR